jgi:hypothetical protein
MTAAHHFYGHNRPLPIAQILNDGSFFSSGWSDDHLIILKDLKSWLKFFDLAYGLNLVMESVTVIRYINMILSIYLLPSLCK